MGRCLSQQGVKGTFIVFAFSAFSCVGTLPGLLLDFHPMTGEQMELSAPLPADMSRVLYG